MFYKIGQTVWVHSSASHVGRQEKRKGIIKSFHDKFLCVWVISKSNANMGWLESFLYVDLEMDHTIITPRKDTGNKKAEGVDIDGEVRKTGTKSYNRSIQISSKDYDEPALISQS